MASSACKISSILIANRGEIACRIIKTCKKLGIKTIAIYSEPDSNSLHRELADCSIGLEGSESKDSYLNTKKVLSALKESGADALHPGYGFLSENTELVEAVTKAGKIFIGPSAEAMRLLGNKLASKALAEKLKVPTAPTIKFDLSSKASSKDLESKVKEFGTAVGFPLMIKAAAGGGGRGMRVVPGPTGIAELIESAMREAEAGFGDGTIFVEKCIVGARHIEVQILGDLKGDVVAIGDRDCTWQRNHQKIIEEAPAPNLPDNVRSNLSKWASALGSAAKYHNAGTVEFLLSPQNEAYFLEVNSRLQVEHPVTELVAGLDLVEAQIRIAEGTTLKDLKLSSEIIGVPARTSGHAIEARLCAEAFDDRLMTSTGRLSRLSLAEINSSQITLRFDYGFRAGDLISHHYDSLLGKVIIHAPTREQAIRSLQDTLEKSEVNGVRTNRSFIQDILKTDSFTKASGNTQSATDLIPNRERRARRVMYAAALVTLMQACPSSFCSAWEGARFFRLGTPGKYISHFTAHGFKICCVVQSDPNAGFIVSASVDEIPEKLSFEISFLPGIAQNPDGGWKLTLVQSESTAEHHTIYLDGSGYWVHTPEETVHLKSVESFGSAKSKSSDGPAEITSPLPGKIVKVIAQEKTEVQEGEVLILLESMKMEHPIRATRNGKIANILVESNDTVEAGAVLVKLV